MKIVLVSDSVSGGAAVACRRLVRQLALRERDSVQWLACDPGRDDVANVLPMPLGLLAGLYYRYCGRWNTRARLTVRQQQRESGRRLAAAVTRQNPDIVNIHNIYQSVDISFLKRLPSHTPLVWTLHDMWPLTGYCCYSYECDKFLSGCHGECPQAGKWGRMTTRTAAAGWQERQTILDRLKGRLSFVTPSRWLADVARSRFNGAFDVEVIPNGLDLEVFAPLPDRERIRACLGLPLDGRIILAGAHSANDPRKGGDFLSEALIRLTCGRDEPLTVVVVGDVEPGFEVPSGWVFTGRVRDERLMNLYYNAADVFVHPSLADNLPNTLVEATAAGTPSVTFDIGGCAEVVRHMKTGYVARCQDTQDLAQGIGWVLGMEGDAGRRLREVCRAQAMKEYDVRRMAKTYRTLFAGLTSG